MRKMKKENNQGKYSQAKLHKSVCFRRTTVKKKKKRQWLLRLFRDFLCFRSWERRRGSGHRQGGGHKVRHCSKILLCVQLGCKRPLHSVWCSPTSRRVLPVLWQSTEGHILRPHASVPFITGCFCLLQHQWQPLELIRCCLCRSLCKRRLVPSCCHRNEMSESERLIYSTNWGSSWHCFDIFIIPQSHCLTIQPQLDGSNH